MLPPTRPAFNTFQQHYSPAKSALPKPPIPTGKHTRSPTLTLTEEETPLPFEVAKQQLELLQLSLLHQSSLKTLKEYEASAHRKLSKKQLKLRKEYEVIRELELEQQHIANLTALDTWCPDSSLLAENLQILSKIHTELSALTEPSSRYAELVSVFEFWIERTDPTNPPSTSSSFLEPLPQEWHKAHTSLALRLRALQRDVEMLPPAPKPKDGAAIPSSVEILIGSSRQLLESMLMELEMMTKLEKGLVERERVRVEQEVKAIGCGSYLATKEWVPAWQSVG
jgi:hypothetical protein